MSVASKAKRRKLRASMPLAERVVASYRGRVPSPPGRFNVYTCDGCGAETVTIDLDSGVTPFIFPRAYVEHLIPNCDGTSRSSMYRPRPGHGLPTWEWYAPSEAAAKRAGDAMYEHAVRGGLFLRRRAPSPAPVSPGTDTNGGAPGSVPTDHDDGGAK